MASGIRQSTGAVRLTRTVSSTRASRPDAMNLGKSQVRRYFRIQILQAETRLGASISSLRL